MNNLLKKPIVDPIPIRYLCDISYDTRNKKIFIMSNEKFFCMEDYRDNVASALGFNITDTVVFDDDSATLIEFKSGKYENISTTQLKDQFIGSKKFFDYTKKYNLKEYYCVVVINVFVYGLKEKINYLKNKSLKKKGSRELVFLEERISEVNNDIRNNGMNPIRVMKSVDFIKKYDIHLCDYDDTCSKKPRKVKCKLKN